MQLWPKLYAFGLSLVRDPHQAEDLCQESYLRLFGMKRPVDLDRPLLPLLLTILKNLAATAAGKPRPVPLDEGSAEWVGPEDETPPESAARKEEGALVRKVLDSLSPEWRSVLYLRDGLGFSYREIAEVIDRTEDSVRVTLHRARQKVRELLSSRGLGERRAL